MPTITPVDVAHMWEQLFHQLPPPMKSWVMQQADEIVKSRRFGNWEEMRLNQAIQIKLQRVIQSWPQGITCAEEIKSILKFLIMTLARERRQNYVGQVRVDRQQAQAAFQAADQQTTQVINTIATIMKTQHDLMRSIIDNLR